MTPHRPSAWSVPLLVWWQMLSNMSDPSSIGPSMAVALLTTLYGAIIANMIGIPLADKITRRNAKRS